MEDFVKNVLARLPEIRECDVDYSNVVKAIENLWRNKYSFEDAVAFMRCTEEIRPWLDEDVALKRMAAISAKYQ